MVVKGSKSATSPKRKAGPLKAKRNVKQESKGWNDMSHLSIKRFRDDDTSLTAGAKRDRLKHPYVACAAIAPSGRSKCKLCGDLIPKNSLRLGLMMECHKGYRNLCTLHEDCFFQHPETKKLETADEIYLTSNVDRSQAEAIYERFIAYKSES